MKCPNTNICIMPADMCDDFQVSLNSNVFETKTFYRTVETAVMSNSSSVKVSNVLNIILGVLVAGVSLILGFVMAIK